MRFRLRWTCRGPVRVGLRTPSGAEGSPPIPPDGALGWSDRRAGWCPAGRRGRPGGAGRASQRPCLRFRVARSPARAHHLPRNGPAAGRWAWAGGSLAERSRVPLDRPRSYPECGHHLQQSVPVLDDVARELVELSAHAWFPLHRAARRASSRPAAAPARWCRGRHPWLSYHGPATRGRVRVHALDADSIRDRAGMNTVRIAFASHTRRAPW